MKLFGSFLILLILREVTSQNKRTNKLSSKHLNQNKKRLQAIHEGNPLSAEEVMPRNITVLEQRSKNSTLHDQKTSEDMKLYFLKNSDVTCNDGTTAGYYLREGKGSKKWIIFLEGGWCCYSKETCDVRYHFVKRLMSSSEWPQTRKGSGILSPRQDENPHWWNVNTVFVPYCSSDVWSGNSSKSHQDYAFMGSIIVQEVIRDLASKGLKQAKSVILAGSSAGGTGVLINLDRVAPLVEELTAESVQVRGLVDSGWFLNPKPSKLSDCLDATMCAPADAIKKGLKLWNGILPEICKQQFNKGDEWHCFYGPKIQMSMKSPVFVVQWLYDEEQLRMENIQPEFHSMTAKQWNNIQNIGRELKKSLHDIPNWLDYQVKSISLARALHCWEKSLQERRNAKAVTRGCTFHLIDNCPWPHCNPTCPALYDHVSGQPMSMLQRFLRLGIDSHKKGHEPKRDLSQLMTMFRNGG